MRSSAHYGVAGAVCLMLLVLTSLGWAAHPQAQEPAGYLPLVRKPRDTSTPVPAPPATPRPTTTPTATTGPTSTPALPPPSFNNCQEDPDPGAAPEYPIQITDIDKEAETVTLRNVTTSDTIDLTGWRMCSIRGNQQHAINGTLGPGASRAFPHSGGPIWNNSERDDGALYTPDGRLVSYWVDR